MTQTNGTKCAEEYVVKRGDSFYLIAHKLGVPLRDLLAANSDIHPARLMVGDVLCVPREEDDSPESCGSGSGSTDGATGGSTESSGSQSPAPAAPAPAPAPTPAVTAPDTTLSCPETEQYTVEAGQTVSDLQIRNLVSRHTLETANPGVDLDSLKTGQTLCIPPENVPCTLPETYTLANGETLESVSMRFNLPVGTLLRCNPCLAPQDFEAGVTVVLPS